MRILHLFANWKWTGPAELAVNLCLGQRRAGHDARLACGRPPANAPVAGTMRGRCRARGLDPVLETLWLTKHWRPIRGILDARRVRAYLQAERIDIVHCHLVNDHAIGAAAARVVEHTRVVRTSYDALLASRARERRLLARAHAALFVSQAARAQAIALELLDDGHALHVESPVDLARFDRDRPLPEMRTELGLAPTAFVVGIVARMQRHRRFETFLQAIAAARPHVPGLRAVVIGRGTHQEEVARKPAQDLGLDEVMSFPGYLDGDRFVGALAALDAKVFLVPGSDASCRAVREAMAMGLPVIAAETGMLPEIVHDRVTGLLIGPEGEGLAEAIVALAADDALRERLGVEARADAHQRFTIEGAVSRSFDAYAAASAVTTLRG